MKHDCAVYKAANILGKRWTLLILMAIQNGDGGVRRYNSIKSCLPSVTPKILSTRLKELEYAGLITKNIESSTMPIRCEYSLTYSGKEFVGALEGFKRWASKWREGGSVCPESRCPDCRL